MKRLSVAKEEKGGGWEKEEVYASQTAALTLILLFNHGGTE